MKRVCQIILGVRSWILSFRKIYYNTKYVFDRIDDDAGKNLKDDSIKPTENSSGDQDHAEKYEAGMKRYRVF